MTMKRIFASVLLAGVAAGVNAQNSGPPPGGQGAGQGGQGQQRGGLHMGPPPEAIAACSGKASGAACNFTGRQGEALTGTCFSPPPRPAGANSPSSAGGTAQAPSGPGERPMACRPDRGGPGQGGQRGQGGGPR